MSTPAAELLYKIERIGGKLTVLPEGQLLCERIPRSLEPELTLYSGELVRLLRLPQPVLLDKPGLKKLIRTVEAAGGQFLRPFDVLVPDTLPQEVRDLIIDNQAELARMFKPLPKASGKPRRGCVICATGKGCRTRVPRVYVDCPLCGHWCRSHYLPTCDGQGKELFAAGCNAWETSPSYKVLHTPRYPCDCPGWPLPATTRKPRRRLSALAGVQLQKGGTI